jgi:hypothetical protein
MEWVYRGSTRFREVLRQNQGVTAGQEDNSTSSVGMVNVAKKSSRSRRGRGLPTGGNVVDLSLEEHAGRFIERELFVFGSTVVPRRHQVCTPELCSSHIHRLQGGFYFKILRKQYQLGLLECPRIFGFVTIIYSKYLFRTFES